MTSLLQAPEVFLCISFWGRLAFASAFLFCFGALIWILKPVNRRLLKTFNNPFWSLHFFHLLPLHYIFWHTKRFTSSATNDYWAWKGPGAMCLYHSLKVKLWPRQCNLCKTENISISCLSLNIAEEYLWMAGLYELALLTCGMCFFSSVWCMNLWLLPGSSFPLII